LSKQREKRREQVVSLSLFHSWREQEFSFREKERERESTPSLSLLEAAFLSQLEAVLLDVASLPQLEAASLSLEEALSHCLFDTERVPPLSVSLSPFF